MHCNKTLLRGVSARCIVKSKQADVLRRRLANYPKRPSRLTAVVFLTGLTVLTADGMDTVDVIDGVVQTAQPVNLVNNLNCQRGQQRPPSIQSTRFKPNALAAGGRHYQASGLATKTESAATMLKSRRDRVL